MTKNASGKIRLLPIMAQRLTATAAPGGLLLILGFGITMPAVAQSSLLTNGGFESGNLLGWSTSYVQGNAYSDTGDSGNPSPAESFSVATSSQSTAPISGLDIIAPDAGNDYALADMNESGELALYQSFVAPTGGAIRITYAIYTYDWAGAGGANSGYGLDYTSGGTNANNQNVRVDLVASSAMNSNAFTTTSGANAVVDSLFGPGEEPNPTGSNAPGWYTYTQTVTGLTAGQSYALRFGDVDNEFTLNMGVDAVSVDAVPEPGSLPLAGSAFALAALGRVAVRNRVHRQRRRRAALPRGTN